MSASSPIRQSDARGLFTLPPEVRCEVYKALFSITDDIILRHRVDPRARSTPSATSVNNAILRTCKTIYTEALPFFYASQRFHYSAERHGDFSKPTFFPSSAKWIKYLSIEVTITVNSQPSSKSDANVAKSIWIISKFCTTLSEFTLHIIPAIELGRPPGPSQERITDAFAYGTAAKALKALRPRLQLLSIVTFGDCDALYRFREVIAGKDQWVEEDLWYTWPGLRLNRLQDVAVSAQQRRYTLAGTEDVVHPHKIGVRVFHLYRPTTEQQSKAK